MGDGTGPTTPFDTAGALPQLGERYRIEKELGRGGMGRVFAAHDVKLMREVAIKMLAPGTRDANALLRFEQEARAAAALDHPNIIAIYDIGHHESGPYIVSELLRGTTLRERMSGNRLPLREVLAYAVQIAKGLAAAHDKGVIHRDLKPENLFVTPDGRIKILDFGIAKVIAPPAASARATRTGAVLGTVGYMSPEQVRGRSADHRSDIFSFGVVLHEMLAGRNAFSRATEAETGRAILEEPPAELPANLPGRVVHVVQHCLEKDPARRFQSAHDLAADLESVPIRPPRRRRVVLSLTGAAVILVLAGAALLRRALPGHGGQRIRTLAVLPLANLSRNPEQEYFVDGMTDELIAELAQIGDLRVISRTSSMRYKGVSKPLREVVDELGVDAVIEGSVERSGDAVRINVQLVNARTDTHLWARSYKRELRDVLAIQDEVARAVAEEVHPRLSASERARFEHSRPVNPAAFEAYLKGLYHWNFHTGGELQKAIAEYERARQLDPDYALAYVGLSDAYHILPFNSDVPPQEWLPRAKEAALKAIQLQPEQSEAHASLAFVLALYDWDWGGAEREYRRAIELNPNNSAAKAFYSMVLSLQGKHSEATVEGERARELDPVSAAVGLHIGRIYFFARQYERAEQSFLRSIEVNPNFWPLHLFLGQLYEAQGRYPEALSELRKAQGPTLAATASMARVHAVSGRRTEARQILSDLIARTKRGYLPPSYVARIYAGLGEKDEAFSWLDRALAVRDAHLGLVGAEPAFDPLRSDARFAALLRRLNLMP